MKPVRTITIREWLPGSYTVECNGDERVVATREKLREYLRCQLILPSDPDDLDKIHDLEQQIDHLNDEIEGVDTFV